MSDFTAKISQSGLLKGSSSSQHEVVASKVEVNTAGINLGDLSDVVITSPTDGSYVVYQSSSNTFLDDQTITKTATGINLTGELVAVSLDISGNVDVDGTLEADAITVDQKNLDEFISDTVGNMITGSNTESGIAVTYDDSDNTLDFNVDDFSITLTGDVTGSGTVTNLGNVSFATTIPNTSIVNNQLANSSITVSDGTNSTATALGSTITFAAGSGLDVAESSGTVTYSAENSDYSNKGIASFSASDFDVSSGFVTIKSGGVTNAQLAGSIVNDKLANSSITVSDGSNTSPVALGGTLTFTGTSNEVTVAENASTVTIGLPDDVTLGGDLSLAQDNKIILGGESGNQLQIYENGIGKGVIQTTGDSDLLLTSTNGNTKILSGAGDEVFRVESTRVILWWQGTSPGTRLLTKETGVKVNGELEATSLDINGDGDISGNLSVATAPTAGAHVTNKTYVDSYVAAQVATVVDSSPAALDTLKELAAALGDDASYATTTATALGNRLRIDVNDQSLSSAQKTNALTNLGVSTFGASLIDDADAAAARTTLGLGTAATTPIGDYATAAQGSLAASALQSGDVLSTLTVTGPLVQNQILGNIFEVIAPDTGDAVDPIISLHRNSASPAANDKLGIIKFNGEDSAGNKTEYASIQANITSPTSDAEYGSLAFNIMNNGTSEAPAMTLFESGLRLADNNDLLLSANSNIQFTGDSGLGTITTLYCVTPTSNRSINLPDASGTVITSGNTSDLGTLSALTVDNININGTTIGHTSDTDILSFSASEPKLTVNAAAMEITDASDTATAGPTLSLYKNRANPANGDQLGRILFLGENDANEKTYYGQLTCEIGGAGVDDGGEQTEFKFHVTDGTPSGTDNNADDLTEDYTTIGPSDVVVLKINSAGCTVNGSDGLILGAGKNIVFTGANNYYGDGAYQNYLRQEEPSLESVNENDNHSYQMFPTGSGVIMRSRGSDRVLDENIDTSTEVITFGSAHGLRTGDPVVYNDAKGTPIQINDGSSRAVDGARFYAIVTSTTAIKLATTVANALAGTALNIVNDGADNQSFLFPNQMDNPIQMRDQVFELGHKTTSERDALTAETAFNGAILYNDTTNEINAYVNSAWRSVATTNAESFTGGMTVTGGLQASQKCIFHTATTLTISKTTHPGTKIVYTSDAANTAFTFPAIVTADIGDTYTILNASNKTVTLNHTGGTANKFKKFVLGSSLITSTTVTIPACGAVEVVVMDKGGECYVVFGSGVIS